MSQTLDPHVSRRLDRLWDIAAQSIRSRRYETAIKSLEAILGVDPKNASAHNRLGIVYAKVGDIKKSTKHFKRAHKHEPSASTHHNLALIYYEQQKYKHAKRHFTKALDIDPSPMATRHIAMAKVYEKLGENDKELAHLEKAVRIEPNRQLQQLFIEAFANHGKTSALSGELIEALQYNKPQWEFEAFDEFPLRLERLKAIHSAMEQLVYGRPSKRLSLRSENTRYLAVTYLHNLSACINLLEKNYSSASANLARSMFEIYLQTSYALLSHTNRGYAILEKSSLQAKCHATSRLLNHIPVGTPLHQRKINENRQLARRIHTLGRRYVNLQVAPSYRQIALQLDGNAPGKNYTLYESLYEKGSDIIHAERQIISRTAAESGTRHGGIFVDSYELLSTLIDLTTHFGNLYASLPEVKQANRQKFAQILSKKS